MAKSQAAGTSTFHQIMIPVKNFWNITTQCTKQMYWILLDHWHQSCGLLWIFLLTSKMPTVNHNRVCDITVPQQNSDCSTLQFMHKKGIRWTGNVLVRSVIKSPSLSLKLLWNVPSSCYQGRDSTQSTRTIFCIHLGVYNSTLFIQ